MGWREMKNQELGHCHFLMKFGNTLSESCFPGWFPLFLAFLQVQLFQMLKDKNSQLWILYWVRLSFRKEGGNKDILAQRKIFLKIVPSRFTIKRQLKENHQTERTVWKNESCGISKEEIIIDQKYRRGETGSPMHCYWECRIVQPLWRTVWQFL